MLKGKKMGWIHHLYAADSLSCKQNMCITHRHIQDEVTYPGHGQRHVEVLASLKPKAPGSRSVECYTVYIHGLKRKQTQKRDYSFIPSCSNNITSDSELQAKLKPTFQTHICEQCLVCCWRLTVCELNPTTLWIGRYVEQFYSTILNHILCE